MARRLRLIGATQEEISQVVQNWDVFDDDWTPVRRDEMVHASDSVLMGMLEEIRGEYPYEPERKPMILDEDPTAIVMGVESPRPLAEVPEGATVAALKSWAGDSKARAQRVIEAEKLSERPRSTLIKQMEAIINGRT